MIRLILFEICFHWRISDKNPIYFVVKSTNPLHDEKCRVHRSVQNPKTCSTFLQIRKSDHHKSLNPTIRHPLWIIHVVYTNLFYANSPGFAKHGVFGRLGIFKHCEFPDLKKTRATSTNCRINNIRVQNICNLYIIKVWFACKKA